MAYQSAIKHKVKKGLRHIYGALQAVEDRLIATDREALYSPIFIIGVPRTGTTLLYQLLSYCFKVCYISNLASHVSRTPCVASYLLSKVNACDPPMNFSSWYGETKGWRSPSQGWSFWDRWFPFEEQRYVRQDEISDDSTKRLRNTIFLMERIYKRPFVNKALSLGIRLLSLNRAFPEALFIRMHRDHLDTAQSILRGREEYLKDRNRWFSAQPLEFERLLGKDCITQVCGQIYYLEKDMDRDIELVGRSRCMDVYYDDLCNYPYHVIRNIEHFYNEHTCGHGIVRRREPPGPFRVSFGKKCNDEEFNKLKKCLQSYYSGHREDVLATSGNVRH